MKTIVTPKQWVKFNFAAKIVKACIDGVKKNKLEDCERTREHFASMFAQLIFNCPKLRSGLISPAGRLQKTSGKDATAEHYRGRKGSGFALYDQAMKGKSVDRLAVLIASRSRVHMVSKQENMKLMRYASQNPYKSNMEIKREYEHIGIILEEFVPIIHRKYDYHIEGVIYTSMKDIKSKFYISESGVDYRCRAPSYPDWKKVKVA